VGATSGPLSEEVIGESIDSKATSLSSLMHEGTPSKSHITEFFSIINDLDKIDVRIEDEDRTLILLCSLPSLYKSFRKVSFMKASQQSRSMRLRSICSIRTKLTPS